MKKYALTVISMLLLLVSACTPKDGGELSFIDETAENKEEAGTSSYESEAPVFPRDYVEEVSSYNRFISSEDRIYFTTTQFYESDNVIILEADPVDMTYRPLCQKPGCTHEDNSCYAYFHRTSSEEYCGWDFQGYDDGLYQYVIPKKAEEPVMQLLKYDPLGKTAPVVAYEIPVEGLLHLTESAEIYPECCLHRGYAVISSEKLEEPNPDLQEEEAPDPSEDEDYDPANPYNEMANMRYDRTIYLSLYDLEKQKMITAFEKTYPNMNHCWGNVYIVDDEIYMFVEQMEMHPFTRTDENGTSAYDIRYELEEIEIYRIALSEDPKPELLFEGKIPSIDSIGMIHFGNDSMDFLTRLTEDCEFGNKHDLVLMNLDFSTGTIRNRNTLFNGSEDAINDGANGFMSMAFFSDGYILGKSFMEVPDLSNPASSVSGERFIIFDMNGEKESEFTFQEELPYADRTHYFGLNICGVGRDCIYCNNSTEDHILLLRVPLDGSEVRYFKPAEGTEEAS